MFQNLLKTMSFNIDFYFANTLNAFRFAFCVPSFTFFFLILWMDVLF